MPRNKRWEIGRHTTMFTLAILVAAVVVIVGLCVKFILDLKESDYEITWTELVIGTVLVICVLIPGSMVLGWVVARNNALTFNEYWNGWEVKVIKEDITCTRDGWCVHEYDCDPYIVMVTYSCNCGKNGCSTCTRPETRYHSCPYVNVETNYTVQTTIGNYTIDTNRFPLNPQQNRWREYEEIPQAVIDNAGVGEHPFWTEVKQRTEAGKPGPVTKVSTYKNFILASDYTILKQYSQAVDKYKNLGLLPSITYGTFGFYSADKVRFVGQATATQAWQDGLRYFNAAFGTELRGDLQLVIVTDKRAVGNPDEYAYALKAYWQDKKTFDKNATPKNSAVVIMGATDDGKVAWTRAFTGMPLGNEETMIAIQEQLKGVELKPEVVIGNVVGKPFSKFSSVVRADHKAVGVLERVMWGLNEPKLKFRRVSMEAKDKTDIGTGFSYLMKEVKISSGAQYGIAAVALILSLIVWVVFVFLGERKRKDDEERPGRRVMY